MLSHFHVRVDGVEASLLLRGSYEVSLRGPRNFTIDQVFYEDKLITSKEHRHTLLHCLHAARVLETKLGFRPNTLKDLT